MKIVFEKVQDESPW